MKFHYSTYKFILVVSSIFTLAGCASVDPGQTAADAATAGTKLKIAVGKSEDLTDYSNTVVVPTAYVKFMVAGKTSVTEKGGYQIGKDSNTVKASAKYKVVGMDKALARQISKQVHDDFVAKLRAAGYKVLTYDDIKDRDFVKSAPRDKGDSSWGLPVETPRGTSDDYIVAAPSDEQQFTVGTLGVFWEFISGGKSKFNDATMIIPTYTITAPQVWGKADSSYSSISAEINTAPGMNLFSAHAPWMGKPKFGVGGGNHPGVLTKKQVINITEKAGEMVKSADTTSGTANAVSGALSSVFGGGSIKASSSEYIFTIDRNAYIAGALKGTGDFNDVVAKVAVAAKAK
jgi:hypothetical protein